MTKAIVITSGKGGVGKTSIAVNVAVELASRGHRTCLVDADLGLANVNILLGIHPEKTLDEVLFHGAVLGEILIRTEHGVDVVPGASGIEALANLDGQQLAGLLEGFAGLAGYEYLLVDTSSGISRGVISFCLAAPETLLVLTAEATSLADAYAVLKVLSLNGYPGRVRVLVNRCASVAQAKKTYLHFKSVVDRHLKIDLHPGGAVLADSLASKAVSLQYPAIALYPESIFGQCIRALVANLVRVEAEGDEEGGGFWKRYADIVRSELVLPGAASSTEEHGQSVEPVAPSAPSSGQSPAGDETSGAVKAHAAASLVRRHGLLAAGSWSGALPVYDRVLTLAGLEQLDRQEMLHLIRHEPLLLCCFLQASAAYSAVPPRMGGGLELELALQEMGEEAVRRLLVNTALHQLMDQHTVPAWTAANNLWFHSCRCGLMCESLAAMLGYARPERAFIAGMLHDIGRLVLQGSHPELYGTAFPPHDHSPQAMVAEQCIAGMSHAELGAEILTGLGLDREIVDAARYHAEHRDRIVTALELTRLVGVAHMLSSPDEETIAAAVELARESLRLSSAQVFIGMQAVSQELNRIAAGLAIPRATDGEQNTIQLELARLHKRAVAFAAMQGVLPSPAGTATHAEEVRLLCDGLRLLFGLVRVICLLPDPDPRRGRLQAVAYPGCYGFEYIDNIIFSLASGRSKVVAAYRAERFGFVTAEGDLAMADRQLLRLMGEEVLMCVPLVAGGQNSGLMVCGISESDINHFNDIRDTLRMYGRRAAGRMQTVSR